MFADSIIGLRLWIFSFGYLVRRHWLRLLSSSLGLAIAVSALMGVGLAGAASIRAFEQSVANSELTKGASVLRKYNDDNALVNFTADDLRYVGTLGSVTPQTDVSVVVKANESADQVIELPLIITDATRYGGADPEQLYAPRSVVELLPQSFISQPQLLIAGHLVRFSGLVEISDDAAFPFSLLTDFAHSDLNWMQIRSVTFVPYRKDRNLEASLAKRNLKIEVHADAQASSSNMSPMLQAFTLNIGVMVGLTVIVALSLLLVSSMRMAEERWHDVLVLRALGGSSSLLATYLLVEALFCGVIGAFLSLTVGSLVVERSAESIIGTASGLFLSGRRGGIPDFHSTSIIVLTIGVAVSLSLSGALSPIIKLIRRSVRTQRSTKRRSAAGAGFGVALIVTVLSILIGILAGALHQRELAIGCALLVTVQVALLAKAGMNFSASLLVRFARNSANPELIVGNGAFVDGLATLGRAAAVGAVSVTLVVALLSMVHSFRSSLADWAEQNVSADIVIRTLAQGAGSEVPEISSEVIDDLRSLKAVGCLELKTQSVIRDSYRVVGTSAPCSKRLIELGRYPNAINEIVVNEASLNLNGAALGKRLKIDGIRHELTIVGVVKDFSTQGPQIYLPLEHFEEVTSSKPKIGGVSLFRASDIESIRVSDVNVLLRGQALATDGANLRRLMLSTFDETFLITKFMRWCVVCLSIITIAVLFGQWLTQSAVDRGVFLLLGASNIEQIKSLAIGTACLSVVIVGIGVFGGWECAYVLSHLVNPLSFGWSFPLIMPISQISGVVLVIIGVGLSLGMLGRHAQVPIQRTEETI